MKPQITPEDFKSSQLEFIAFALYTAASEFYADEENQKAYEAALQATAKSKRIS